MRRSARHGITDTWIAELHLHVRANFETGQLYWLTPGRGKCLSKPIGCTDQNGYRKVTVNLVSTYAHLIIYYLFHGVWPASLIDHKDRNPGNNRPDNLELSNHSKNAMNSGVWAKNTTGVRGVSWSVTEGKYKVTKQGRHLGYFNALKTAEQAYNNG